MKEGLYMKQGQLSWEDILTQSPAPKSINKHLIYSPKELAEQGKKYLPEDEKRWTEAVWEVQRRERSKDNWIDWFEACDMYRKER